MLSLFSGTVPSPPLSPTIHGSEETSQIGAILESVCNTKDVTSATIAKLCEHVKADPQEQQVGLCCMQIASGAAGRAMLHADSLGSSRQCCVADSLGSSRQCCVACR